MINKKFIVGCLVAVLSYPIISIAESNSNSVAEPAKYQLKQVLLMSRHNLRSPLAENGSALAQSTPNKWPQWEVPGGYLTTKGGVLEVYMGRYFRDWLKERNLIDAETNCPEKESVYAYANSLQRTVATAEFFIAGAFPGCDIPVHHQQQIGVMDPVFSPSFTNGNEAYLQSAIKEMEKGRQQYKLDENFNLLEQISNYHSSPACENKTDCILGHDKETFIAKLHEEPGMTGSLKIANSMADAFILQYYQGFPLEQIAWGKIKTQQQWLDIMKLRNAYQDILFSPSLISQNVALPLLKYLQKTLIANDENKLKMTLLVGHDSNIASLLSALNVEQYQLPEQYENTPIGGKVIFQHWYDTENKRDLIKIEYLYQGTEQLRRADLLTKDNQPHWVTLKLKDCPTDEQGFCNLADFQRLLSAAISTQSKIN